jgi:L-threonylcarbamoyladenylate synthase
METVLRVVDPQHIDPAIISEAAEILRRGSLVAFPTETVYGLGANALDAEAVASIYAAKGRPANNPVIVHIHDIQSAQRLTTEWPEAAQRLAERFWPGPLTLVLPKAEVVPDIVTAGGPTVALRVPAHPVAQALLRAANLPIAAPSANRSSEVSPTTAAHVLRSLDGRIAMILDGGPAAGGIESTVLDLTTEPPRLLRPGLVTRRAIEAVIGRVETPSMVAGDAPLPSPGIMERHYAPRAGLETVEVDGAERVETLHRVGLKVGWLAMGPPPRPAFRGVTIIEMPDQPAEYASRLYATLHDLDDAGVDRIVADLPPDSDEWVAVRDRLRRASA